ncbi:9571_t:CDS:2 [Cetraspora pellucida]|uniref:9571_t:CDS:1 n=1 Tax=Cetraspora pellucida TaxID=1433469 RepID=A0ACA9K5D9_9GLOM|nr:9571_t:CDS:2 [Cetraspora pellucida]
MEAGFGIYCAKKKANTEDIQEYENYEDKINQILQHWIKKKERKIRNKQLEDELEFSEKN